VTPSISRDWVDALPRKLLEVLYSNWRSASLTVDTHAFNTLIRSSHTAGGEYLMKPQNPFNETKTFAGLPVQVDRTIPVNTILIKDRDGRILQTITNIQVEP